MEKTLDRMEKFYTCRICSPRPGFYTQALGVIKSSLGLSARRKSNTNVSHLLQVWYFFFYSFSLCTALGGRQALHPSILRLSQEHYHCTDALLRYPHIPTQGNRNLCETCIPGLSAAYPQNNCSAYIAIEFAIEWQDRTSNGLDNQAPPESSNGQLFLTDAFNPQYPLSNRSRILEVTRTH